MSASNRRSRVLLQAIAAMGFIAGWAIVVRAGVPITLIADTSTPIPGGSGNFTGFGLPVADRDNPVAADDNIEEFAFPAQGSGNLSGIYGYVQQPLPPSGTLTSVYDIADTSMAAPTGGNYAGFSSLSSGYAEIGFIANTTTGTQLLMANDPYDPLTVIAQTGTSPAPGQTFGSFQSLSVMEGTNTSNQYVMEGEVSTNIGIYDFNYLSTSSGPPSFSLVANSSTTPPGASSPFTSFGSVSFKAGRDSNNPANRETGRAVLATVGGVQGIYYGISGISTSIPPTPSPLAELAAVGMTIPGGAGQFTSFGNPIASSGEIAFAAQYSTVGGTQQGIFTFGPSLDIGLNLTTRQIAATGEIAPDSDGAHFANFSTISAVSRVFGEEIGDFSITTDEFFIATLDNGVEGLYAYNDQYESSPDPSDLTDVLDTTEALDGKSIADIEMSPEAAGDSGTAFRVDFTDGSEGIYYFQLPEPAVLSLLALPVLLVIRRRRQSQPRNSSSRTAPFENQSYAEELENRRLLSGAAPIGIDAASFSYNGDEYQVTANCTSDAAETANTTAINEAIDEVYSQGGGVVYLPGGTAENPNVYSFNGSIHLLSYVILRGESAAGTVISYTGSDVAIEITTTLNGSGYSTNYDYGIQNLTIKADSGSAIGDDYEIGTTAPGGAVRGDFENLAIEAGQAGISLSYAQDSYFNDIQFSNFGSAAIDIPDSNAGDYNNIVIANTPSEDFTAPAGGMIDIAGQFNLLHNIWIDFNSPVLDFNLSGNQSITLQGIWIAQDSIPTVRYKFASGNQEASINTLTLDQNDLAEFDGGVDHAFVDIDDLQIPADTPMNDYLVGSGYPAVVTAPGEDVHVDEASSIDGTWPTEPTEPTLDGNYLIPTEGIDVTQVSDPPYALTVGNYESNSTIEQDNYNVLQDTINDATGPVYLPAGEYDISQPLTVPAGTTILGDGDSTIIWCNASGDGVLELTQYVIDGTTYNPDNIVIGDMILANPSGYGISAKEPISGGLLPADSLTLHDMRFATDNGGIYLPSTTAEVTNSHFIDFERTTFYGNVTASLQNSLIDISGYGNTLESFTGTATNTNYDIIVNSDSDSEPTYILAGDTENSQAKFYYLSGPDINFFGNYLDHEASGPADVVLDDATYFNADNLGIDGGMLIENGSSAHIRFSDVYETGDFASASNLSNTNNDPDVVVNIDSFSSVSFDTVNYNLGQWEGYDGITVWEVDRYGLPDSELKLNMPEIQISQVDPYYNTPPLFANDLPGFDDVVIQNPSTSSIAITSREDDPNQLTISNSNASVINATSSEDDPYIIGADANTTVTLDYSSGIAAGSAYFEGASGYTNKIILDDPAEASNLTFVQGPPDTNTPGLIGLSNVQEIDTGSGSYNVTLDFSGSAGMGSLEYYDATGENSTVTLIGSSSVNAFNLIDGANATAGYLGLSGVALVQMADAPSDGYDVAINDLGGLNLSTDSDGNIDIAGVFDIAPDGITSLTFWLNNAGDKAVGIYQLPTEIDNYVIEGYGSEIALYGDSSSNPFTVGPSSVQVNGDMLDIYSNDVSFFGPSSVALYDSSAPGDLIFDFSDGSPMSVDYTGEGGELYVSAEGSGSYTFIPENYYDVSTVIFEGDNDTLSLPLHTGGGKGGGVGYGLPSYSVTFNGSGGDDTVDITADSTYDSFEIGGDDGDEIIVNPSTTDYIIETTGVENVNITGGSEADSVTVDADSLFSNVTFTGGTGDQLAINDSVNDDVFAIESQSEVEYNNGHTDIQFPGVPSVTLQATGENDAVSATALSSTNNFTVTGTSLTVFGQVFNISGISKLELKAPTSGDSTNTLTLDYPADGYSSALEIDFNGISVSNTNSIVYNDSEASNTIYAYNDGADTFQEGNLTLQFFYIGTASGDGVYLNTEGGNDTYYSGQSGDDSITDGTPINITVPSGSLALNAASDVSVISLSGLTVDSGAEATVQSGGNLVLQLSSLNLGSSSPYGTLDLTDEDMILSFTSDPINTIFNYLQAGYNSGGWDGTGIISSIAAGASGTTLGYLDNSTAGSLQFSSFDGQNVGANVILVKYTYVGDANLDGKVDATDLAIYTANDPTASGAIWSQGDFNYDGKVNADDASLLSLGAAEYDDGGPL